MQNTKHLRLPSTTSSAVAWSKTCSDVHDADDTKVLAEYINVRMCDLKGGHNCSRNFFSIFIEHIVAIHK